MRAKVPLSVAMIWILCACAAAQSRSTNTGVVSGVVEDSQGARVSNAKVLLRDQNRTRFEVFADKEGQFQLELPAGDYTFEVQVIGGFKPYRQPIFHLNAGDTLKLPISLETMSIPNTSAVAGVVQDPQEAVIPTAKIHVKDEMGKSFDAVTDEAGEFWLDVPAGVYSLEVREVRGFVPFSRPKFRVHTGDKLWFPIRLDLQVTGCDLEVSAGLQDIVQFEEPEPTCNSVQKTLVADEELSQQLVVTYRGRTGTGATREYAGATLFCDVYSVKADKIVYDSGKRRADAEGRVVVEDGHTTRRVQSAVIQWPECRPEIVE